MLIKTYDSEEDPYYPCMHTSFCDPQSPPDAERRSVEVRVLALIPQENSRLSKSVPLPETYEAGGGTGSLPNLARKTDASKL